MSTQNAPAHSANINGSSTSPPCSRCSAQTETYKLRKDHFCTACLQYWIQGRASKRLVEGFRIPGGGRDSSRRVLVPLSGGISSLSLLHLLGLHAEVRQARIGRIGYEVIGLWVDETSILGSDESFTTQAWELVKTRYGQRWEMVKIDVQDVFSGQSPLREEERQELIANLPFPGSLADTEPLTALVSLLKALPEPSSRADLLTTLRTRLINAFAQRHGCSVVVWGDTTTRLAEKTLAETAKGRGFSLPWQTGDGATPFEGIKYIYPFQDLYRKEIELWAEVVSDPKIEDIVTIRQSKPIVMAASSRNLTIDDLMRQYFAGVEESYPSIVTNVVRTSNKLEAPCISDAQRNGLVSCCICGLLYDGTTGGLGAWEGNQKEDLIDEHDDETADSVNGHGAENGVDRDVCYGCSRTLDKAKLAGPV